MSLMREFFAASFAVSSPTCECFLLSYTFKVNWSNLLINRFWENKKNFFYQMSLLRGIGFRPSPLFSVSSRRQTRQVCMSTPTPESSTSSDMSAPPSPQTVQGDGDPPPHLSRMRRAYCCMCGSPMHLVQLPTADWRHRLELL